ncbi:MAG: hypothetical protein ABR530_02405 [Pyrinomonadaceae bacterium]
MSLSCSSEPTDLRALVPVETLVYLETNDLGAALQTVVESYAFERAAASKPDLSPLKGVQLAVAITGFESSEQVLTEEHSVGRIQPRFVAVVDTHLWSWQTSAFVENKLGSFVADSYGAKVTVERSDKHGGTYFVWSTVDGRNAFALVLGSLVLFGNDETLFEKCLAVKRGEAESIHTVGKVPSLNVDGLAVGYVSTDGVGQIASVIGLKMASEAGDESEIQSAIAGILPMLIRNSITDITWTAAKTDQGIEDKLKISTTTEVAPVLNETLTPDAAVDQSLFELVPPDAPSITLYNLKTPHVAWRSVLLAARTQTDPVAGQIIAAFSGASFEPYGIGDGELFLSGAGTNLVTANFDAEGEKPVVIASILVDTNVRKALLDDLKPHKPWTDELGVEMLRSDEGDLAAAFIGTKIVVGNAEGVIGCVRARSSGKDIGRSPALVQKFTSNSSATTLATDWSTPGSIARVLSEKRTDQTGAAYITETRFTRTAVERRTVSELGLIGSIIAQLDAGE